MAEPMELMRPLLTMPTNNSQLYFDFSAFRQPPRLYRLVAP
jgi:hypothetical protein